MVIPRVTRHRYRFFAGLNSHTRTHTHGKTRAKPAGIPIPVTFTTLQSLACPENHQLDLAHQKDIMPEFVNKRNDIGMCGQLGV
jgi:hypothetical protein